MSSVRFHSGRECRGIFFIAGSHVTDVIYSSEIGISGEGDIRVVPDELEQLMFSPTAEIHVRDEGGPVIHLK